MSNNKKILLIGGALVLAYLLLKKKKNTMVSESGKEKIVEFNPISVKPMPWIGVPNSLPEIKIN
jgi:hypothetical protein